MQVFICHQDNGTESFIRKVFDNEDKATNWCLKMGHIRNECEKFHSSLTDQQIVEVSDYNALMSSWEQDLSDPVKPDEPFPLPEGFLTYMREGKFKYYYTIHNLQ